MQYKLQDPTCSSPANLWFDTELLTLDSEWFINIPYSRTDDNAAKVYGILKAPTLMFETESQVVSSSDIFQFMRFECPQAVYQKHCRLYATENLNTVAMYGGVMTDSDGYLYSFLHYFKNDSLVMERSHKIPQGKTSAEAGDNFTTPTRIASNGENYAVLIDSFDGTEQS